MHDIAIRLKRLPHGVDLPLPAYATAGAAGMDVVSAEDHALAPGARLHASYFEAPTAAWLTPLAHTPGEIVTHCDRDPFHYAFDELRMLAGLAGLHAERIGDWGHPRGQRMAAFFRP